MDVGGGDEGVDPPLLSGVFQRLPGPVDILLAGAAQTGDLRPLDVLGDHFDRLKIPIGGDRETGLDDIHVHFLEMTCQTQFLLDVHAVAGGLFAVPQGGVEDPDDLLVVLFPFFCRCLCHSSALLSCCGSENKNASAPNRGEGMKALAVPPFSSRPSRLLPDTRVGCVINGSTYMLYASSSSPCLPWSLPKSRTEQWTLIHP